MMYCSDGPVNFCVRNLVVCSLGWVAMESPVAFSDAPVSFCVRKFVILLACECFPR